MNKHHTSAEATHYEGVQGTHS